MSTSTPVRNPPKYARLAEMLRAQIHGGELRPGDRLPSFSEMQAQHSVALTTVTKIHDVLEREGLIERQHGRGTFVAERRRVTHCLGLWSVINEKSAYVPYWAHLIEGAQEAAHAADYEVMLLNSNSKTMRLGQSGWHLDARRCRAPSATGARFLTVRGDAFQSARRGFGRGGRFWRHGVGGRSFSLNWAIAKIGFLAVEDRPVPQIRLAGYRSALMSARIQPQAQWVRPITFTPERTSFRAAGHHAMKEWLQGDWQQSGCSALLCQNDETALGALRALHEANIAVPQQVSVMGFDGTELCEFAQPTLTSVEVPLHQIGAQSVRVLLEQIQLGARDKTGLVLPTQLKIGGSTGPLSI